MISTNAKEIVRSIPAATIERIEVITEPRARYSADGIAAIINIITHKGSIMESYVADVALGSNPFAPDFGTSIFSTTKIGLGELHQLLFQQREECSASLQI